MQQIGSGGILAALWDLTEASGTGMKVDMAEFSIRQETVELCEFYRLNPYLLTSAEVTSSRRTMQTALWRSWRRRGHEPESLGLPLQIRRR